MLTSNMAIQAQKKNMTQIFAEDGTVLAVTRLVLADEKDLAALAEGAAVVVSGTSKGKGFQGVVKRHGFKGGRRTHGQKHSEREPGSIGGGGRAGGKVAKGMRMAGRMGNARTTVKNLHVMKIFPDTREVMISGAVPGRRGASVEIKNA